MIHDTLSYLRSLVTSLLNLIKKGNIRILVALPIITGLLVYAILLTLEPKNQSDNIHDLYLSVTGIVCSFIFSISGIIQIYRREGPGISGGITKGVFPVITGIAWVLFTCVICLLLIIS